MTEILLGIVGGIMFPYLAMSLTLPVMWIFGTEGVKHSELFQLILLPGFIFWIVFLLLAIEKGFSND